MTPTVTVTVCSHNGERRLPATLAHLARQTLSRSAYELIVVDDGSTDRTADVGEEHGARVVRLHSPVGLAAARNAGVRAAQGSIIAFTDDDCEPDKEWLSEIVAAFSDPELDGVSGRVVAACPDGYLLRYLLARNVLVPLSAELLRSNAPVYRLWLYLRRLLDPASELPDGASLYSVVGANMALRRKMIVELGGFDESFTFGAEEEDLCRRGHARASGARLRYRRSALVVHRFAPVIGDSLRRARAYGRGHARASLKHRDLRLIVYPVPLMVATMALGSLAGNRKLALAITPFAPLAGYFGWIRHAAKTRSFEPLTYSYLQLAEEVATMLGELEGVRAGYTSRPNLHLVADLPVVDQSDPTVPAAAEVPVPE